ncbi:MAG: PspC domain-containing protein [Anaerolineales bacterium]|nr:PspC domain-containing protein [Anaerolineales bacterium]MDD5466216.1 PspC domain-containing protein [Anaerolineales bacterium]
MSNDNKRLYRSRRERMVAGVCGGVAEYFNADPTLVRLLFVFGTLLGGPGLLAYLIMMVVVPEEPAPAAEQILEAEDKSA